MICNADALPVLLWLSILPSMTIGQLLNLKKCRRSETAEHSSWQWLFKKGNKLNMDSMNFRGILSNGGGKSNTNWCKSVERFNDSWHYIDQSIKRPKHKFALAHSFFTFLTFALYPLFTCFVDLKPLSHSLVIWPWNNVAIQLGYIMRHDELKYIQ